MGGIFAVDGKATEVFRTATDLVKLNLLWLLCGIPVVTIGASTTALYSVAIKMVKNEESYVVKDFFSAFRKNLKQATVVWLMICVAAGILFFDFYFSSHAKTDGAALLFVPFAMAAILLVMLLLYVFPVMAVFENRIKKVFKNSLLLALAHLPQTLLVLVISMGPLAMCFLFASELSLMVYMNFVFGIAFFAWINAHVFVRLFHPYMTKENEEV